MLFLRAIDSFLNKFTMYRVVLYSLLIISTASILLSFFGLISYNWFNLLFSVLTLLTACYVTNLIFSKIFKVAANTESNIITALILFLIMQPAEDLTGITFLILASVISMGSKYIVARHKKHIFNPAAFAAVTLSYLAGMGAIWWVSSPALLPFTVVLGLLIVRKIRRFTMFFSYFFPALASLIIVGISNKLTGWSLITQAFTAWPLVFFGTVMFTEPRTMPYTRKFQIIYGVFVGIFSSFPLRFGPVFSTPELVLLAGNVFAYIANPKRNLALKLSEMKKLAPDIYGFSFIPDQKPEFAPGQYLEWTLPHKSPDSRGNRRFFTIASSPTEQTINLGVKISEESSSFKKALLNLKPGDKLNTGTLAGDFTLPQDSNDKIVFIAGGIGITPFRSMVQYLIDTKQKRDIVLFYVSPTPSEFVFKDVFDKAGYSTGLKTFYVISKKENAPSGWKGKTGRIDEDMIKSEVPDYAQRIYYLSGPNSMVEAYKELLSQMGIAQSKIVTDYFSGY